MNRERVVSSTLTSVGYDAGAHILELEFPTGEVYQYLGVIPNTHRQLINADSKGRFFNKEIRNRFPLIHLPTDEKTI